MVHPQGVVLLPLEGVNHYLLEMFSHLFQGVILLPLEGVSLLLLLEVVVLLLLEELGCLPLLEWVSHFRNLPLHLNNLRQVLPDRQENNQE